MDIPRLLRHIVKDYFDSLELEFDVLSSSTAGGETTINVWNVLHLNNRVSVTIDSVQYPVVNVNSETQFVITGNPGVFTKVTFPKLEWYAGTPKSVANDTQDVSDPDDKYPMIYFYEIIQEDFNIDLEKEEERESLVRIFFLDQWNTSWQESKNMSDFYEHAVDGLSRFAHYFMKIAEKEREFGYLKDGYRITPYPNFGSFQNLKGFDDSVFNDDLCGVELRVNLPVLEELNCT